MRIAFATLGCKVNQYETEALTEIFAADGFEIVPPEAFADIYALNSCTVTAESDRKVRRLLRRFRRQNPDAIICLCGCMPQAFPEKAAALSEADIVLGTKQRAGLLSAVKERLARRGRYINIAAHMQGDIIEPLKIKSFSEHTRAFVKIQDGCERFCTYCIIPHARGPVRSKPPEELHRELIELVRAGYSEIVLVGINLSCYGSELGLSLIDAIRLACGVEGIERVRLGSLEPELLSDADIAEMARLPQLCPQFHLSLQSGCDETLRRMGRHYDTAEYSRIVETLRKSFEDCAITTDIMVGFPGESEEEFEKSLSFAKEIAFARAHVFAYSIRPGTPAAKLSGQIPKQEKLKRSREMIALTTKSQQEFLESMVGKTVNMLPEQRREDGRWEGYSENYTHVLAAHPGGTGDESISVLLTGVEGESCVGIGL